MASFFHANTYADNETEYQAQLKELAQSIKALQTELNKAKGAKDSLQGSLQTSEQNIADLSKKISSIKEALAREKKHLNQLQQQRAELETQRNTQQKTINIAIRQAHRLGQESQLKLLLNQENPIEVNRLIKYHDYIVDAHQQDIIQYQSTLKQLNKVSQRIQQTTATLERDQSNLLKQQQSLKHSQRQRKQTLAKLSSTLKQKGQELSALQEDRQRLEKLLEEATKALATLSLPSGITPFKQAKGQLPLPTTGKIIHRFGSPQFEGKLKRNGILIGNKMGADVVSVHYGRVIFSDYLRGHGLLLIVDHGDGYMSLYGHNETLLKDTGDWVNAGEVVGTVGRSGGQTTIGLYFEIRFQGRPLNPHPWLAHG